MQNKRHSFNLTNQKGAFSPFMFGLLMGVTLLSGMMQHWANEELKRIEAQQKELTQEKAEDVKRAVENMIITENSESGTGYQRFFDLETLKGSLTSSTGKTRSGQDIQITTVDAGNDKFGNQNQRIVITSSDDAFKRQQVKDAGAGIEADDDVVIIDTSDVRQKQIEQSKEYLEMESAQLYRYYISNEYKFPDVGDYSKYNSKTGLKDMWGNPFKYEKKSNKKAQLSFTTPWGYTYKKTLNLE